MKAIVSTWNEKTGICEDVRLDTDSPNRAERRARAALSRSMQASRMRRFLPVAASSFEEHPEGEFVLLADAYPTLHAIGLGPQLAELERICAGSAKGKHAGETILQWGEGYHWNKAISHLNHGEFGARDNDSGARHLIHAVARLLMAAACLDAEER